MASNADDTFFPEICEQFEVTEEEQAELANYEAQERFLVETKQREQ